MKVLMIDGMSSPRIIWNALSPIAEKYGASATYSTWYDWSKQTPLSQWDVICGHSLGGDSAVQICNWLKYAEKPQPKLLITMGARYQSATSWLDFISPYTPFQNFTAPNNVTHNFYTRGPLALICPSAPMTGAVENVNVASLTIGHINLPYAPQVQKCLNDFLERNK